MRIAKPILLVSTPVGVAFGLIEAWRVGAWLGTLMLVLLPHHDAALLERAIGIRLDGVEFTNVEEYCISEGWIRVTIGKAVDRRGRPLTIQRKGAVEPFFKE